MKTNPGGQLAPNEVFGREKLIENLWRVLERQSVVLSAERRMGKTSVIKKMVAESPGGILPVYRDLEGVRNPLEFVELVFHDVERYLTGLKRTAERVRLVLANLGGAEVKGVVKFPEQAAPQWKKLLQSTVEDLIEHQDKSVIFFWDELPLMLYNIKGTAGEPLAMEMLDVLRSLRQTHPSLRMVFTGSIGLHNVISALRRQKYANDPTNDMKTVDVPPLTPADAQELASRLLAGEGIPVQDGKAIARSIAEAADNIPFFIHHIVDQLTQHRETVNERTVASILTDAFNDPQDTWHLRYYRERIDTYYEAQDKPYALSLLDALAVTKQPLGFDGLFDQLKARMVTEEEETVRRVLTLLQRDHYVVQQPEGGFAFRFPLICRCWRHHRGL